MGVDVFIYDYRGFGRSTGTSSEASLMADAAVAYEYVNGRAIADSMRIVTYGYSLGGFPATFQAATYGVDSHVMEACFASGEEVVRSGTLLDIPGDYVLEGRFDNADRMRFIACPVLIIHGEDDAFIDINRHGAVLYARSNQPKTLVRVVGGRHSTLPTDMGIQTYLDLVGAFIRGS